jgi:hypothetical protein
MSPWRWRIPKGILRTVQYISLLRNINMSEHSIGLAQDRDNAGKLSSGYTIGGISSSALFQRVTSVYQHLLGYTEANLVGYDFRNVDQE